MKTTTKIKVREIKSKIPLRVEARRKMKFTKFGEAKDGEENVTLKSVEFVAIEHPDDQLTEDTDDPTLTKTLANFISKQAESKLARDHDISLDDFSRDKVTFIDDNKGDRYVAPGSRGGPSLDSARNDRDGGETTIRVSNLTKAVTEDDLRDLFERFGRIFRISLPRIEKPDGTKEPKGFAYIAFADRRDAEQAMNRLQGYGYDHLIIKLEWAKPTKEGGDAGMSSRYMSGYGKQLAQDTQEKVYYNSSRNM